MGHDFLFSGGVRILSIQTAGDLQNLWVDTLPSLPAQKPAVAKRPQPTPQWDTGREKTEVETAALRIELSKWKQADAQKQRSLLAAEAEIEKRKASPPGPATPSNAKERIAIVDFSEKGDVGIKDVGQTVSELLAAMVSLNKYQLVERSQLAALLKEQDVTMAAAGDNPNALSGKIKGVRYLLLGTVTKLGKISVTARIVDVQTGDVVRTATATAQDADGLPDALRDLSLSLQLAEPAEKTATAKIWDNATAKALERKKNLEAQLAAEKVIQATAEAEFKTRSAQQFQVVRNLVNVGKKDSAKRILNDLIEMYPSESEPYQKAKKMLESM